MRLESIAGGTFENHVSFEGIEATRCTLLHQAPFENHVSFEGIEASSPSNSCTCSLRTM